MGYWADAAIVVTDHIGLGPAAKHEKTFFVPDTAYQESEIARIYAASGRQDTYLGDWHSHPTGTSRLSWRDCTTLRNIAIGVKGPIRGLDLRTYP